MTVSDETRQQFRLALVRAVGRVLKKHPDIGVPDLCSALGVAAGYTIGRFVPPGHPEMDVELAELTGLSCSEALKETRKAGAS